MKRLIRVSLGLVAGLLGLGQPELVDKIIGAVDLGDSSLDLLPENQRKLVPFVALAAKSLRDFASSEMSALDEEWRVGVEGMLEERLVGADRAALLGEAFRGEKHFYAAVVANSDLLGQLGANEAGYLRLLIGAVHSGVQTLAQSPAVIGIASMEALRSLEKSIPSTNDLRALVADEVERALTRPMRIVAGSRPRLSGTFIDRSYTPELASRLNSANPGTVSSLWGLRGVGKSQLASAFALECETAGWWFVAWISAASRAEIVSQLSRLATQIGLSASDMTEDKAVEALMARLNTDDGSDRLVVFDNVNDFDDLAGLIPRGARTRTLITSTREPPSALFPTWVTNYDPREAEKHLLSATGQPDDGSAGEVCRLLGYLPLAITQASSTIRRAGLSYEKYIAFLLERELRETLWRDSGEPYELHVEAALALAIETTLDTLADRPALASCAANLLDALSLLAETGIDRSWAAEISPDPLLGSLAPGVLLENSLLTTSVDGAVVRLHRLLAQVIRERNARERKASRAAVIAAYLLRASLELANSANSLREMREHVARVASQFVAILQQSSAALLCQQPEFLLAGTLTIHAANGLSDPRSAVALSPLAYMYVDYFGVSNPTSLEVLNNLAFGFEAAGDTEVAIQVYELVVAQQLNTLGPSDPGTLLTMHNLAGALESAGEVDLAIPILERTLEMRRTVLGEDHPDTLTTFNDFAFAINASGDSDRAVALFEECVDVTEAALGTKDPFTLRARNNLANCYLRNGDLEPAMAMLKEVLAHRESILGREHEQTITSVNNLGNAQSMAGDDPAASITLERALADSNQFLGADHPLTLRITSNLAALVGKQGNHQRAATLWREVAEHRERTLGPFHQQTVDAGVALAFAITETDGLDAGIEYLETILGQVEELTDSTSRQSAIVRRAIIAVMTEHGRGQDARSFAEQRYERIESEWGPENIIALTERSDLADALMRVGAPCDAAAHLQYVIEQIEAMSGGDSASVASLRSALENALQECDRSD